MPLRSSWSKGRSKNYAYYLCQTKGCSSYGKSVARDKLEGDVGELIKSAQPVPQLFTLAKAMFRYAWDASEARVKASVASAEKQIKETDKQIDALVERNMGTQNSTVLQAYEAKLVDLELHKQRLSDQASNLRQPSGTFEEKLEPALQFLASLWKIWESGETALRRTVVKLVFAGRLKYCRNGGARTAEFTLPFKALGALSTLKSESGAGERRNLEPNRPQVAVGGRPIKSGAAGEN